jgi:uncharacterized membrane protein
MSALDTLLGPLTVVAAIACAVVAGIFFAFSNFVMDALRAIQPAAGLAAMQAINLSVLNPVFLSLFMGTSALSLLLGVLALTRWAQPTSAWLLTGSLLFVLGSSLVTAAGNVPLNEALARLDPTQADASRIWSDYTVRWTRLNHLRTAASLLATVAFSVALALRYTREAP